MIAYKGKYFSCEIPSFQVMPGINDNGDDNDGGEESNKQIIIEGILIICAHSLQVTITLLYILHIKIINLMYSPLVKIMSLKKIWNHLSSTVDLLC